MLPEKTYFYTYSLLTVPARSFKSSLKTNFIQKKITKMNFSKTWQLKKNMQYQFFTPYFFSDNLNFIQKINFSPDIFSQSEFSPKKSKEIRFIFK
jgi:hypothetical protein